jgi:hypothetical protein
MGDNAAFTNMEATVLACYNRGVLDKPLLKLLLEPYRDTDIDSGGMKGTLSRPILGPDGVKRRLDVKEIIVQVWTGKPPPPCPRLPKNKPYQEWTPEQRKANDDYVEQMAALFGKITGGVFGWC